MVRGSRVKQKRVPFPTAGGGVFTLSHPRLPGRKQESYLSQAWHSLGSNFELSFSLILLGLEFSVSPLSQRRWVWYPRELNGKGKSDPCWLVV